MFLGCFSPFESGDGTGNTGHTDHFGMDDNKRRKERKDSDNERQLEMVVYCLEWFSIVGVLHKDRTSQETKSGGWESLSIRW